MINILCMIFGEHCPVYSIATGPPQQQQRLSSPGHLPSNSRPGCPTQNLSGIPQPSHPERKVQVCFLIRLSDELSC